MLIITCEHASSAIPLEFQPLFTSYQELLQTHRGYDIGTLELAKKLARQADFSLFAEASRLLVELNRSLHHPKLFSDITKSLTKTEKQTILADYYFPYRESVEQKITQAVALKQKVIHIAVHSFTPNFNGQQRNTDIGLLYDSRRLNERNFCQQWKQCLLSLNPQLKIRYNYPYDGKADGFPTYLRKRFTDEQYIGIELEVNQKFPLQNGVAWQKLQNQICQALMSFYQ